MEYRRFDQSITFWYNYFNLDLVQWIICCVKSSIFSSGGKHRRTSWTILSEGPTRNICMKIV